MENVSGRVFRNQIANFTSALDCMNKSPFVPNSHLISYHLSLCLSLFLKMCLHNLDPYLPFVFYLCLLAQCFVQNIDLLLFYQMHYCVYGLWPAIFNLRN